MKCFVTHCTEEADEKNGLRIIDRTVYYCDDCFKMIKINLSPYPTQKGSREISAGRWKAIEMMIKKRRSEIG